MLALAGLIAAGVALASQGNSSGHRSAQSGRLLQSMFEDEQLLVYQPMTPAGDAAVAGTLAKLRSLGVDDVRVVLDWYYLAPDNNSRTPPSGFNAANPAAYPASSWAPYDRLVRLANRYGIVLDFDVSGPGPLWAMAPGAPNAKTAIHYEPSASAFRQFMTAVGRRYDGSYRAAPGQPALSRVTYWSIWNEPNQPGWLAPQWSRSSGGLVPLAARLYRQLADAGYAGLASSGHTPYRDTILFGELAPEGCVVGSPCVYPRLEWPIPPMPYLRAMYCLDSAYRPLRGTAAAQLGCPESGSRQAFVSANPVLFHATGFAHHPYAFFLAPGVSMPNPDFVPLSDLSRIETGLDRAFSAYGVSRRIPLFLTEYGYETSPPRRVPPLTSLAEQSSYLNQATYMAWRDPRVQALSQFLLRDSAPDTKYPPNSRRYWSTFQTGLEYLSGAPKPSLFTYRLPIFLPSRTVAAGGSLRVWGMLRVAPNRTSQSATVQWKPAGGAFRSLASVTTTDPSGVLRTSVKPPASGRLRIAWRSPSGQTVYSQSVPVTVSG